MTITRVRAMPNIPQPFHMRDWRAVARGFDKLAFDLKATGEHLPLVWLHGGDETKGPAGFAMGSYVGDYRKDGRGARFHESITCAGALLGATVAGIDKTQGEHDWVRLCEYYYDQTDRKLFANRSDGGLSGSFWYEIFPHIIYYALADRYPKHGRSAEIVRKTAAQWLDVCDRLKGTGGKLNFDHTGFDFHKMRPVDNGKWTEPDAAAGIGWLHYAAWRATESPKHLAAARACIDALNARKKNPCYEVQLPFGAYTAARMNAELACDYDVGKIVNWCFDRSDARVDMMVIASRWGDNDCHGLVGAVNVAPWRRHDGGYAFAMNTYVMAWPLVPLVRYDQRFARAIGKWMLNAANAARLFYGTFHPPKRQSCPTWGGEHRGVVAYEGIKQRWDADERLYASGDPVDQKWGPETDLGLYGSAFVGIFGGIVSRTNVKEILRLDLLATDFYRDRAYPTGLYFNPHKTAQAVDVSVGETPRDLYDTVTGRFVARGVKGKTSVTIAADSAVVLVVTPAGGKVTRKGRTMLINGVAVDYRAE